MSTVGRGVIALALLVLAAGGCAKAATRPGVATAATPSPGASTSPSASAVAAYLEGQRQWVACLRQEGFDVPDPDAKGRITMQPSGPASKTNPKFRAALDKCSRFTLPVPEELQDKEHLTPQQAEWRRAYARCMRANGATGFADPEPDGSWPRGPESEPATTEQQAAAMFRAGQICEPILAGRPTTTPNPRATGAG